jgi:hypothetical protein
MDILGATFLLMASLLLLTVQQSGRVPDLCCAALTGSFIMIRLANGSSLFINAREQAPAAATPNMFEGA